MRAAWLLKSIIVLIGACFALSTSRTCWGQCAGIEYRVSATNEIDVQCAASNLPGVNHATDQFSESQVTIDGVAKTGVGTASLALAAGGFPPIAGWIIKDPNNLDWLRIVLASNMSGASSYSLILTFVSTHTSDPAISVSTSASLTFQQLTSNLNEYNLASSVALVQQKDSAGKVKACSFTASDLFKSSYTLTARCALIQPAVAGDSAIGSMRVIFDAAPTVQWLPLAVAGITDIFGNPPSFNPGTLIAPRTSIATEPLLHWYFNGTFLGATGSSPAWTLNAQVIPYTRMLGKGWMYSPFVGTANVGQGTIPTATFTDTVNMGSTFNRVFVPRKAVIDVWTLTPGLNGETDKELDTWNLLGTVDVKFDPKGLFHPQIRTQLGKANGAFAGNPTATWTVANATLPTFGYVFEAHAIFEGGKKLEDTVVYNSDKSASMVLPEYPIARPGVQVHGLLQFKRLSADSVFTGRYLLLNESSVLAHKDNTLYLYQFHGWKGYQVFTGA
jgi:hypothetical protein